jgi:antitoxin MazE
MEAVMRTRVRKWGNSLAIRIPSAFAQEIGLEQDGEVELSLEKGRLVIVPDLAPRYNLDELVAGIQPSNLHDETDWGPAVGKEVVAT